MLPPAWLCILRRPRTRVVLLGPSRLHDCRGLRRRRVLPLFSALAAASASACTRRRDSRSSPRGSPIRRRLRGPQLPVSPTHFPAGQQLLAHLLSAASSVIDVIHGAEACTAGPRSSSAMHCMRGARKARKPSTRGGSCSFVDDRAVFARRAAAGDDAADYEREEGESEGSDGTRRPPRSRGRRAATLVVSGSASRCSRHHRQLSPNHHRRHLRRSSG